MILIILGTAIIGWVLFKLAPYHKLKSWDKVEGIITKSDSTPFKESQVYVNVTLIRPSIEYSFSYNGREFKGHTISLEDHSLKANPSSKNLIWSKWAKDKTCPIYVNPSNPQQALLYRGILPNRINHYLALIVVAVLLIAVGILVQYAQP